jgi:hypothetical protein
MRRTAFLLTTAAAAALALPTARADAATLGGWNKPEQRAVVRAGLLSPLTDGRFHGEQPLTGAQLAGALGAVAARDGQPPLAAASSATVSVTAFDARLVTQLGLADVARHVQDTARAAGLRPPRLVQIPSPYRSIVAPLLKFVSELREKSPQRALTVVIPALVEAHWWDHLMHTRRAHRLRETLLRHGGPRLAVVLVPWTLEEPHPEAVIAAEEPPRPDTHHPTHRREPHAAK